MPTRETKTIPYSSTLSSHGMPGTSIPASIARKQWNENGEEIAQGKPEHSGYSGDNSKIPVNLVESTPQGFKITPVEQKETVKLPETAVDLLTTRPIATHNSIPKKIIVKFSGAFGKVSVPYSLAFKYDVFLVLVQDTSEDDSVFEPPEVNDRIKVNCLGKEFWCIPICTYAMPGNKIYHTIMGIDENYQPEE